MGATVYLRYVLRMKLTSVYREVKSNFADF